MSRDGEIEVSDLTPPLCFLEQLSHHGRENTLWHWKRPGAAYGLVSMCNWKSSACTVLELQGTTDYVHKNYGEGVLVLILIE